ncbi:MAG TPA: glycoside hydrolase family 38 C-terminal domain-containing protein [Armatimonadota bacterium]
MPEQPTLVETIHRVLSDIAATPVAGWSATPSDDPLSSTGGGTGWAPVELPNDIYGLPAAWYRTTIVTPEKHHGWPVAGLPVTLILDILHYGEVYVNGRYHGRYHRGNSRVVLVERARPGQTYEVAIRVAGPGSNSAEVSEGTSGRGIGLHSAVLEYGAVDGVRPAINAHLESVDVSTRLTALTGKGDYVLTQAAEAIDRAAIASGNTAGLLESIETANETLSGLDDLFKRYTIALTANAHIDMAWLWDREETKQVCHDTFRSVLNLMREYPDFIFAHSQAQSYEWVEQLWPDIFEEVKQRVNEGRWEIVGGMWVEPDCNLPCGESFVRQVVYGKRYFMEKFGKDVTLGWNPDSFGYNWSMPQVYKKCGISAFLTQKLTWNDTNLWPYRAFWWESPDNSRIFSYFPTDYVGHVWPNKLISDLAYMVKETGFNRTCHLYGIGDHGGGPTRDMLDRADSLAARKPYPAVKHERAHDFVAGMVSEAKAGHELPVWNSELYLEYHRGTFTSQAAIKRGNREAERLLRNVEAFSVLAGRFGLPYPGDKLKELWKLTLFNQFHDILPGSCIGAAAADAASDYAQIQGEGGALLDAALKALGKGSGAGSVVVANPMNWARDGVASIALEKIGLSGDSFVVTGPAGPVPSQVVEDAGVPTLLFLAKGVPALGVATYTVAAGSQPVEGTLSAGDTFIENANLRVEIAPNGTFTRVYDKAQDFEAVEPGKAGNLLQAFVDNPGKWEAWEIDKDFAAQREDLTGPVHIEVLESGPVRARVRTTRQWRASTFVQDVILTAGSKRVDVVNRVDWHESRTMIKVLFPANVQTKVATYEVPYAAIERSTGNETSHEKAQFEVPALQWADLSVDAHGVSLLNDCKHGHDIKGNAMRLTLLRSPNSPDPKCDRGVNVFTYSFYPHAGGWVEGKVYREAHSLNDPLIARPGAGSAAFVEIAQPNVVISALKAAEDGDDVILRFFETAGLDGEAELIFAEAPKAVWDADMMENALTQYPSGGTAVTVPLGHNEVKTLRLTF